MRIVLDTTVLVRASATSRGLARQLLLHIVESDHVLLLSNEMLHELARVLRYPRLQALHGLPETRIYDYIAMLRYAAEIVVLDPLLIAPVRDVNDMMVVQTAVIGEADFLCTTDQDFFAPEARAYLQRMGTAVLDDVALMEHLRLLGPPG